MYKKSKNIKDNNNNNNNNYNKQLVLCKESFGQVLTFKVYVFQSNEVKSSYHMELEGLKRSLSVIKNQDVDIQTLVTDRHSGIKKYLREQEKDIDHRFDCWHMATSMLLSILVL